MSEFRIFDAKAPSGPPASIDRRPKHPGLGSLADVPAEEIEEDSESEIVAVVADPRRAGGVLIHGKYSHGTYIVQGNADPRVRPAQVRSWAQEEDEEEQETEQEQRVFVRRG